MEQKIPAVSVIIPMYNAEDFIGICLESLFVQTFKNFEVIVVDHCSTDNSYNTAESYLEKFGENGQQLNILKLKSNFGNACVPRNEGLKISHGKYIYFMDADDLVVDNALETLYNYAENYNVDVVCMHKYFSFEDDPDKSQLKNPQIVNAIINQAEIPVSLSENIAERMNDFFQGKIHVMPWLQFSRRDFLVKNKIYFPEVLVSEDDFWIIQVICAAKKMLLIPEALYAFRQNLDSMTHSAKTVEQKIKYHISPTIIGMKTMSDILHKEKFFQENPQYWYAWVSRIVNYGFSVILRDSANLNPHEVYNIFYEQFAQDTGEHAELISYLCSMINTQQKQLYLANQRIAELEKKSSGNKKFSF